VVSEEAGPPCGRANFDPFGAGISPRCRTDKPPRDHPHLLAQGQRGANSSDPSSLAWVEGSGVGGGTAGGSEASGAGGGLCVGGAMGGTEGGGGLAGRCRFPCFWRVSRLGVRALPRCLWRGMLLGTCFLRSSFFADLGLSGWMTATRATGGGWGNPTSFASGGGSGGFSNPGPTASATSPAATTAPARPAALHRIRRPRTSL